MTDHWSLQLESAILPLRYEPAIDVATISMAISLKRIADALDAGVANGIHDAVYNAIVSADRQR